MKIINYLLILLLASVFYSCKDNSDDGLNNQGTGYPEITSMDSLWAQDSFNWTMTDNVSFKLRALDNADQPIPGVRFDVYMNTEDGSDLIFSGMTGKDGFFSSEHPFAEDIKEVTISSKN